MRTGVAMVISAPSGAGKSTLAKMLLAEFPDMRFSVSCTTRAMRQGEENGRDYFFTSRPEFERMRDAGDFAEWAEVHGNLYGTPLRPAIDTLAAGHDMLFDVDVQGAAQIRLAIPGSCFVFILPPDMRALEARLRARGQDGEESIRRRMAAAVKEIRSASWFDAIVLNDDLHAAYDRLRAVYLAATLIPDRNRSLLARFLEG